MLKLTIAAFNCGKAGKYYNGPGICLNNFINQLKNQIPDVKIEVFTYLSSEFGSVKDINSLKRSIRDSDIFHVWSGMIPQIHEGIQYANKLGKKVILGPNLIDCVEKTREVKFLKDIEYHKLLTVNLRLRYLISKTHNIEMNKVDEFLIGPDFDHWYPDENRDGTILWKGNGKHFVKDVKFALALEKNNKSLSFKFIGHPNPYDYFGHIHEARKSSIYICTSLSETMGMALAEQWAAGIPSVTHPKIYMHGINYVTGIISNKTIEDYTEAINEMISDRQLYSELSRGAAQFARDFFSYKKMVNKYLEIIK